MEECIFCKIINREAEGWIVYENDYVCCFLDKYPINKGHILVVPKRHFEELAEADGDSLKEVILASQKVAAALQKSLQPDGITVMQNNGIFKDVNHYHMHVFPRWEGDGFSWTEPETTVNPEDFSELYSQIKENLE
ncbi:HIT family protein [Bacillus sp. B-jedd]|uniref:HIT family protein n=1 Tax=Bacillus sp. B-jedd TaxID=1476857 RepID=UPI0005157007|nr:HIT family protein [Bacillus sp. B-jedd]CEG25425.1 cell-cycle regulation histidine [Bacillus sp. B-jedd]